MRLKKVFAIFLILTLVSSCATFKPLPTKKYSATGVFEANFKGDTFNGFFSVSSGNLRLDVVNSFGFSVYGIYVKEQRVFLKDYQTGKVYHHLKVNGMDLDEYKPIIRFTAQNFFVLCKTKKPSIVVLECKKIDSFILPVDFILKESNRRLRIRLKNIKVEEKQ